MVKTIIEVGERLVPGDCQSMADVRQGVDALDRALVALLTERQGYMDAAARIKADRSKVFDRARIEDVVDKVKAAARESGLSEAIAEPVWRTLVDRCIAYEYDSWDRRRARRPPLDPCGTWPARGGGSGVATGPSDRPINPSSVIPSVILGMTLSPSD
jgi:isochorismate pyruvate lyase